MRKKEAEKILQRYLEGNCTPAEAKLVESWLDQQADTDPWQWAGEEEAQYTRESIKEHLVHSINKKNKSGRIRKILIRFSAAACLLALSVISFIVWKAQKEQPQHLAVNNHVDHVVQPGSQSAVLTLGDGSVIDLGGVHEGILKDTDGLTILQNTEGQLVYESTAEQINAKVDTNRLSIPFGGFYKVVLHDGTKVSLNAGSTLTYPARFTGKNRKVKLTGEAFFEVTSNKERPFIVAAGDTEIEVTGTSFNVSAYEEEERTTTTLMEGEVYVRKEDTKAIRLLPGEQSSSKIGVPHISKKTVDIESSIAWVRGYFVFDDQDIESVLRQLSRWYDVDIYIEKTAPQDKKIGGTFARQKDIQDLLHYLEKLNVIEFKKQGRRITVMI